ncbi:MAG: DUF4054 domain-containing protein [Candidatus Sphingomonas colombiensis]|nr:DUF4054 domain-containing protein [Sphingomonas sp.]WEK42978.1 MAG: DUF4054 domain-containing protein [Sphingomonas sp.]
MPDLATFRIRYPAFANVPDVTVEYWLTDAGRFVDDSWPIEGDRDPAMMAVAAHHMMASAVAGIADGDVSGLLASGVTQFQSGGREGFRVALSDAAIQRALAGGYEASRPGQEYLDLLYRNKGGPRSTLPGAVPCANAGFNGFAGPLGYPARFGGR